MASLVKKIYYNPISILYIVCIVLGMYYFSISEMTLVEWLYASKYIGLYMNSIYFLFIVKRVSLYKTLYFPMRIRMKEERFMKFLMKSFALHLLIYFILVYSPFMIGFTINDHLNLLIKYFFSVLIAQLLNEYLILLIIDKNLSSYVLSVVLIINFLLQFIVIEHLI